MVEVKIYDRVERFKTPVSVRELLKELGFLSSDVLVIKDGRLLTKDVIIKEDSKVEVRVVYSKG